MEKKKKMDNQDDNSNPNNEPSDYESLPTDTNEADELKTIEEGLGSDPATTPKTSLAPTPASTAMEANSPPTPTSYSSNSPAQTQGPTSKFWIPEVPSIKGWYNFRKFKDEPNKSWWQQNDVKFLDMFTFILLIGIGILVISITAENFMLKNIEFYSKLFFNAGYLVAVQKIVFELFPLVLPTKSFCNHLPKCLRIDIDISWSKDDFSIPISFFFVLLGILLQPSGKEYGGPIFTAGLMKFIESVIFFQPSPRYKDRKNELQIKDLESSMARGLADGYFFNLVAPIAKIIRDKGEGTVELDGKKFKKAFKKLYIIVPRSVPLSVGINYDCEFKKIGGLESVFEVNYGKIITGRKRSVSVLGDDLELNHDFKGDLYLCDVPTTLSAVAHVFLENLTDNDVKELLSNSDVSKHKYTKLQKLLKELAHNDNDSEKKRDDSTTSLLPEDDRLTKAQKKFDKYFEGETNVFCYRLAWRLQEHNLIDFVKIIEMKRLTPDEQDSTTE